MTKANIDAAAKIIAQQKAPKWDVEAHVACVSNRIVDLLGEQHIIDASNAADTKPLKAALRAMLATDGLGSNASQFRQALQHKDVALIPPGEAKLTSSYE